MVQYKAPDAITWHLESDLLVRDLVFSVGKLVYVACYSCSVAQGAHYHPARGIMGRRYWQFLLQFDEEERTLLKPPVDRLGIRSCR